METWKSGHVCGGLTKAVNVFLYKGKGAKDLVRIIEEYVLNIVNKM